MLGEGRKEEQRDLKHVIAFRKVLFLYSIYFTYVKDYMVFGMDTACDCEWCLKIVPGSWY